MRQATNKLAFGLILRELRQKKELSLRDLARKVDMGHAYMGFLENGQRTLPGHELMQRLAHALDTSYEVMQCAIQGKRLIPWMKALDSTPENQRLIITLSLASTRPSSSDIAKLYQALAKAFPKADISLTISPGGHISGGVLVEVPVTGGQKQG